MESSTAIVSSESEIEIDSDASWHNSTACSIWIAPNRCLDSMKQPAPTVSTTKRRDGPRPSILSLEESSVLQLREV